MKIYGVEYREKDLSDYLSGVYNCWYTARRYFKDKTKAEAFAITCKGTVIEITVED